MSADQLIAHALDLFASLGSGVTARKMFGALGFYAGGRFFAVGDIEEGAIYLKVDEVTRGQFEAAGGRPFTYPARDGSLMEMSYLTPPDAALEDPEAMLPWARLGIEAADRAAARKVKPPRKSKPAGTTKPVARAMPAARSKPAAKSKPAPKSKPEARSKPPTRAKPAPKRSRRGSTRRATRRAR